jgi:hypothetical protein
VAGKSEENWLHISVRAVLPSKKQFPVSTGRKAARDQGPVRIRELWQELPPDRRPASSKPYWLKRTTSWQLWSCFSSRCVRALSCMSQGLLVSYRVSSTKQVCLQPDTRQYWNFHWAAVLYTNCRRYCELAYRLRSTNIPAEGSRLITRIYLQMVCGNSRFITPQYCCTSTDYRSVQSLSLICLFTWCRMTG